MAAHSAPERQPGRVPAPSGNTSLQGLPRRGRHPAAGHSLPASHLKLIIAKTYFCT
jgi:hypothetical protein